MDAKAEALHLVDSAAGALTDLSHRIHAQPELKFEEHRSSRWCADVLAGGGFDVDFGVCDLDTAFIATAGSGPLTLAICAEYDALPGVGHACGHNIIASAAVGAGLALAPLADDLGVTVNVIGTPAEEGGGGKIFMLQRGAFRGVNAAMMVHPAPTEMDHMPCLAAAIYDVGFHGKEAHASAFPELGVNALDAFTVAQTAVGLLRQHIPASARIHGIITRGGDAPNIVPAETAGEWMVREANLARLNELRPRVERCFEAGALATGCTHEMVLKSPPYSEFADDAEMMAIYKRNAVDLGRAFPDVGEAGTSIAGSTDMGNVSLAMPAIHPLLGLGCYPVSNHQPEFAAFCATPVADRAVRDGAAAMAWTCIDLAADGPARDRLLARAAP